MTGETNKPNKSKLYKSLLGLGLGSALALSGAFLIAPQEGVVNSTYIDPVGILTSCYGHTGPELKLGQVFTEGQCNKQFAEDLIKHDQELSKLVKVSYLSDYEHAALLSFTYNVGTGNVKSSSLLRKLNDGDHIAACSQLVKWVFAQGKDCRIKSNNCSGIVTRRTVEMRWCLGELTQQELKEIGATQNAKGIEK